LHAGLGIALGGQRHLGLAICRLLLVNIGRCAGPRKSANGPIAFGKCRVQN
jgi:hypothetical protein